MQKSFTGRQRAGSKSAKRSPSAQIHCAGWRHSTRVIPRAHHLSKQPVGEPGPSGSMSSSSLCRTLDTITDEASGSRPTPHNPREFDDIQHLLLHDKHLYDVTRLHGNLIEPITDSSRVRYFALSHGLTFDAASDPTLLVLSHILHEYLNLY